MPDQIYSCLIVDDEPHAKEVLRRYIGQLPMLSIAGECSNALQAMVILKQQPVDLLFLDIQMPRVTGMDLLRSMHIKPKVILTTAFEEYALQAFDLDVTDYLLKPISFERFLKAVMKALPSHDAAPAVITDTTVPSNDFFYVRAERKMIKVVLDDILYIESLKDYVRIHTSGADIITKHSMVALEALLPESKFIRLHRSFIVALKAISSFSSEKVNIGDAALPVGKLYRLQVMKKLQGE